MDDTRARARAGLLYGLAAYGSWGLVAFYFKAVAAVPPAEVLAHRIAWSVVFLVALLSVARRWGEVGRCLRSGPALGRLSVAAFLLAVNWLTYIYSVSSNQLLQASLGYFTTPLVNVLLGLAVLGERLRPLQWAAVGLAAAGVANLFLGAGEFPWIALTLAVSFGLYGLLRKQVAVDGVVGLTVETGLLLPPALGYLAFLSVTGAPSFGNGQRLDGLLVLSGLVTTVPLICFGQAARRLRLATLGFLQYLSPSLQLLLAVGVFGEPFRLVELAGFVLIWSGLVFYVVDAVLVARQLDRALVRAAPSQARP